MEARPLYGSRHAVCRVVHGMVVRLVLLVTLCFLMPLSTSEIVAGEFRVENSVYLLPAKKPISQTVTFFTEERIYDLSETSGRAAIFDLEEQQVTELDLRRRMRIDFELGDVESFTQQWQTIRAAQKNPMFRFLLQPRFATAWDAETGRLTLESRWLTYRVATFSPDDQEAVDRYIAFSDVAAKMAPMLDSHAPPPFPRLAMNPALRTRRRLPQEVRLTRVVQSDAGQQEVVLRAVHHYRWHLTADDRRQIEEAEQNRLRFNAVNIEQFRKLRQTAKRRTQRQRQ